MGRPSRWKSIGCLLSLLAAVSGVAPRAAGAADDRNVPPPKRKMSQKELARLRIAEFQAGARTEANRAPDVKTLVGPPLSEREKAVHVLNRMAFGARPGEVEEILKEYGGWERWAKEQLEPDQINDSDLEKLLAERFPWTRMSLQEIKKNYDFGYDDREYGNRQLQRELPESVLVRAALSNRQFKEVMCEFWRNHFFVNQPDRNAPMRSWTACDYEEQVIRKHAFGKFRGMLYASATHPAMLEYLDNWISRANAWNENYARELMELHTLGADKGYTEQDVLEVSKVLTGWTFDPETLQFTFKQEWHQPGSKRVLGRSIAPGIEGGKYILDSLANSKRTADFISFKLCRYLVNDNPPPALVTKVSRVFQDSNGDLPKVYWAILSSPEFMSRENFRAKFKTPFEFTVSALRVTDAQIDEGQETTKILAKMGQAIYNCDDPTGYYDQAEAWMDAGVLTSRWDYAWRLAGGQLSGVGIPEYWFKQYEKLKPEQVRAAMVDAVIGGDVGDRTQKQLDEAAQSGDVQRMVCILLGSPDFQQQ